MNDKEMSFQIPTDVVECAVRDKISAAIARELGDPAKLIQRQVELVLSGKVDANGKTSTYRSDKDLTLIQYLSHNCIRKAAQQALGEYFADNKQMIVDQVKKAISKGQSKIAKAFVEGLVGNLACEYSNKVEIKFSSNGRD